MAAATLAALRRARCLSDLFVVVSAGQSLGQPGKFIYYLHCFSKPRGFNWAASARLGSAWQTFALLAG